MQCKSELEHLAHSLLRVKKVGDILRKISEHDFTKKWSPRLVSLVISLMSKFHANVFCFCPGPATLESGLTDWRLPQLPRILLISLKSQVSIRSSRWSAPAQQWPAAVQRLVLVRRPLVVHWLFLVQSEILVQLPILVQWLTSPIWVSLGLTPKRPSGRPTTMSEGRQAC